MDESKDTSSTKHKKGMKYILINPDVWAIPVELAGSIVEIASHPGPNQIRISVIKFFREDAKVWEKFNWWAIEEQLVPIPEAYQKDPKLLRAFLIMSGHEDAAKYVEVPEDED